MYLFSGRVLFGHGLPDLIPLSHAPLSTEIVETDEKITPAVPAILTQRHTVPNNNNTKPEPPHISNLFPIFTVDFCFFPFTERERPLLKDFSILSHLLLLA